MSVDSTSSSTYNEEHYEEEKIAYPDAVVDDNVGADHFVRGFGVGAMMQTLSDYLSKGTRATLFVVSPWAVAFGLNIVGFCVAALGDSFPRASPGYAGASEAGTDWCADATRRAIDLQRCDARGAAFWFAASPATVRCAVYLFKAILNSGQTTFRRTITNGMDHADACADTKNEGESADNFGTACSKLFAQLFKATEPGLWAVMGGTASAVGMLTFLTSFNAHSSYLVTFGVMASTMLLPSVGMAIRFSKRYSNLTKGVGPHMHLFNLPSPIVAGLAVDYVSMGMLLCGVVLMYVDRPDVAFAMFPVLINLDNLFAIASAKDSPSLKHTDALGALRSATQVLTCMAWVKLFGWRDSLLPSAIDDGSTTCSCHGGYEHIMDIAFAPTSNAHAQLVITYVATSVVVVALVHMFTMIRLKLLGVVMGMLLASPMWLVIGSNCASLTRDAASAPPTPSGWCPQYWGALGEWGPFAMGWYPSDDGTLALVGVWLAVLASLVHVRHIAFEAPLPLTPLAAALYSLELEPVNLLQSLATHMVRRDFRGPRHKAYRLRHLGNANLRSDDEISTFEKLILRWYRGARARAPLPCVARLRDETAQERAERQGLERAPLLPGVRPELLLQRADVLNVWDKPFKFVNELEKHRIAWCTTLYNETYSEIGDYAISAAKLARGAVDAAKHEVSTNLNKMEFDIVAHVVIDDAVHYIDADADDDSGSGSGSGSGSSSDQSSHRDGDRTEKPAPETSGGGAESSPVDAAAATATAAAAASASLPSTSRRGSEAGRPSQSRPRSQTRGRSARPRGGRRGKGKGKGKGKKHRGSGAIAGADVRVDAAGVGAGRPRADSSHPRADNARDSSGSTGRQRSRTPRGRRRPSGSSTGAPGPSPYDLFASLPLPGAQAQPAAIAKRSVLYLMAQLDAHFNPGDDAFSGLRDGTGFTMSDRMRSSVTLTEYGARMTVVVSPRFSLVVHLKDTAKKCKAGKRWSMVLYTSLLHGCAWDMAAWHKNYLRRHDAAGGDDAADGDGGGRERYVSLADAKAAAQAAAQGGGASASSDGHARSVSAATLSAAAEPNGIVPLERVLVLMTDCDTQIDFDGVRALLDTLIGNPDAAGACGFVRPVARSAWALTAYQNFCYSMSHWQMKGCEAFFGSVLCSPGAYSMYRLSILHKVMGPFSKDAKTAEEYLRLDQGEDRHLCTLLIARGYKLLYCALAVAYTSCPTTFAEWLHQQRRWIVSTFQNSHDIADRKRLQLAGVFKAYCNLLLAMSYVTPVTVVILTWGALAQLGVRPVLAIALSLMLPALQVGHWLLCRYMIAAREPTVARVVLPRLPRWLEWAVAQLCCRLHACSREALTPAADEEDTEVYYTDVGRKCDRKCLREKYVGRIQQWHVRWCEYICHLYFVVSFVMAWAIYQKIVEYGLHSAVNMYLLVMAATVIGLGLLHFRDIWGTTIAGGLLFFLYMGRTQLVLPIFCWTNGDSMKWGTREAKRVYSEPPDFTRLPLTQPERVTVLAGAAAPAGPAGPADGDGDGDAGAASAAGSASFAGTGTDVGASASATTQTGVVMFHADPDFEVTAPDAAVIRDRVLKPVVGALQLPTNTEEERKWRVQQKLTALLGTWRVQVFWANVGFLAVAILAEVLRQVMDSSMLGVIVAGLSALLLAFQVVGTIGHRGVMLCTSLAKPLAVEHTLHVAMERLTQG